MDTTILNDQGGGNKPPLPSDRQKCRERIIKLQFEISSIRDQIASADMDRQARGGHMNARWYHRARTALRIKKEELAHLMDHIKGLPDASRQRKASLKDAIIETVREDYDDDEWQSVMDDAHHLLNSKGGA